MQLDRLHVALIATLIYDAQAGYRNKRRFNQLQEQNQHLWKQVQTSAKQVDFLCNLMDEHNVPVTEFDKIVFNNLD